MIKNILFDFGNVLFDLDLGAFEREMSKLYGADFESAKAGLLRERVFELYETGGLSTAEFIEKLCQAAPRTLDPESVVLAWNAILIGMPGHRFQLLLRLRQQYKVFMLSNINELHERWVSDHIRQDHGIDDYESLHFDGVYFSHLIRLRKPSREAFEYVLADAEILPEETVFFDDLPDNIATAQALGIHGVWHDPGTEIQLRLEEMGLLPR